ncbi:hypothetical protein E3N88_35163 [Mikania micrantha]|uniref:Uncharacterized protein n=1 Tax=Mikania micrantha TaxID=192012 RepID=A0A5N6M2Z1_9ASTR|nr:hypothetical protein E3N88_35163 [Mikania micrantha]
MRFGKLLYLDIEEIPSKLGYFVAACFDCNKMEMLVGNHKVNVDSKAINRLLGIPKEGLNLILIKRVRKLSGYVATWRDLYQSDFVVASEIVARIMSSKDESVMFEIDFIVLLLTTMVECTVTGKSIDRSKEECFEVINIMDNSAPSKVVGITQGNPEKAHGDDEELITGNAQEKTHKMCEKGDKCDNVAFNIPLGDEQVHKKENVVLLNKPTRAKIISEALRHVIFEDESGTQVEAQLFRSAMIGRQLYASVVDSWTMVLNFEEKRSPDSPHRLFCDTKVIDTST